MDVFEQYLTSLAQHRASGAALPETSSYPTLANLLNSVGSKLRPKVCAIIQLSNSGAGFPDGGLFSQEQLKGNPEDRPLHGLKPSRGAIEVKPFTSDLCHCKLKTSI